MTLNDRLTAIATSAPIVAENGETVAENGDCHRKRRL